MAGARRGRPARVAAGALGVLLLCCACGTGGSGAGAPAAAPPTDVRSTPQGVGTPDPPGELAHGPVLRSGGPPHPTVSADPGALSPAAPVSFPDGVSLAVVGIHRGVERGQGPGVFPGRPHTAVSLVLTNGSTQPVDLGQVVVTTVYGVSARLATPVYEDPAAKDFAGTVEPGASASATYVFAIPPGQAGRVVTTVDFDAVHVAARFTGEAQG